MENPKKQHGGDVIDKLLAAQTNAALAERNRIAKEDKKAADRHRAEMQNIERKKVEVEKQKIELEKKKQDLESYAMQQCKEIHSLYGKIKKHDANSSVVTNFLAIRAFEASLKSINIDVITDIAYRDRYDATSEELDSIKKTLIQHLDKNHYSLLMCYDDVIAYVNRMKDKKIHSYDEKENIKNTIEKIDDILSVFPELIDLNNCKDILRKCTSDFDNRMLCVKSADTILRSICSEDIFHKLIIDFASEKNIMNFFLDTDFYKNIPIEKPEKDDCVQLYYFLEKCIFQHKEKYCSDVELQKIVDHVAIYAEKKSINVAEKRLLQQQAMCVKKIKELCVKYSRTLKSPEFVLSSDTQEKPSDTIAETKAMFLVPIVKIFGDRLCIYTAFKRKEIQIPFDDFITNASSNLKKKMFGKIMYGEIHIASNKQYYDFFVDLQKLLKEYRFTRPTQAAQQSINTTSTKKDTASESHHSSKKVNTIYAILNIISIVWLLLGVLAAAAILSENYPKDIGSIVFLVLFMLALFFSPYCFIRWLRNKHVNKSYNNETA